jgi:glycosyltransferase involved in cell wall biosynthesis
LKPRVLFVGRTRYRLPLDPALARKWDALGAELDLRVLARAAGGVNGHDPVFRLASPIGPQGIDGAVFYATLPFRVARELRTFRPEVLFVQSPYEAAAALAGRKLARSRARVVLELHGDWRTATRLYGSRLRRLLEPVTEPLARAALRRADALRTISGYTTELVRRRLGREPAAVFPAYVDLSSFVEQPVAALPERPRVLFVGVLERYKGIDVLAKAWRLAAPRVPDALLHVVGDGRAAPIVERLVADLTAQTAWTRRIPSGEVARELDRSTALVLPSRSEGLPRIVIEAFCRGRPVIGTRAGGIPDIVTDGVNGVLVLREDPVALGNALVRVLSDGELQRRLADGARAGVAQWLQTPEQYADRVRELVTRVAAAP